MSALVVDIETDGLKPTCIWTVVANGVEYRDPPLLAKAIEDASKVYMHNGISFDAPVLKRLWHIDIPREKLVDTLVLSRLADPSRKGHALDDWGQRLGHAKPAHEDWSQYSEAMRHRCMEDVAITTKVVEKLESELEGFSEQSIDLEHRVQWIIADQMRHGWLLDRDKAIDLLGSLTEKLLAAEEECRKTFVPLAVPEKKHGKNHVVEPRYTKDGKLSKVGAQFLGDDWQQLAGPCTRIEWQEFNLGSTQQIGWRLQRFGWKPLKFTETGQPVVSDDELEGVEGIPEVDLIRDYLMLQKRTGQIRGWLEAIDEDGRVRGYVNSNGAVTGRMTHSKPNLAQVTAHGKPYGAEMRACWIVPTGFKLVGCDASGLELRMLAHYMNDPDYAREVVEGDVHWANVLALGLVPAGTKRNPENPEHEKARALAKRFIYAFLYGAGDAKIGLILGVSARQAKRIKQRFLDAIPALKSLIRRVQDAARRGYLMGLDGRKVYVRSAHAALNTLLQSAGAIVMKEALWYTDTYAKKNTLTFAFVGNIHDEFQAEVAEKDARKFAWIAEGAIAAAGERLGLRVPLAGEAKIGNNWSETH